LLIFTEEYNIAMEFISEKHPAALPDVLKFKARASPFNHFMFSPNVLNDATLSPLVWWLSLEKQLNQQTTQLVRCLFTAVASSAGVERVFSTFGFVHSDVRNRLGTEKAAKLTFMFKVLNS
jgi:hypothetical protein